MSWLVIRAFFGGALKSVVAWLSHRSFWQIVCMALALLLVVQHFQLIGARHSAAKWHKQFTEQSAAYTRAQAAAKAKNDAQIASVKAEQERITSHVEQSYETDLARVRADLAKRLRAVPQGGSVNPGASPVSNPSGKSDDTARVSIPDSLYVRGAELELQLERLQQWVAEQVKLDPNK